MATREYVERRSEIEMFEKMARFETKLDLLCVSVAEIRSIIKEHDDHYDNRVSELEDSKSKLMGLWMGVAGLIGIAWAVSKELFKGVFK